MRQLSFDLPYYYEDLLEDAIYLEHEYPESVKVIELGESHDGRSILAFAVGRGEIPVIITGGVHGRETINPMVLVRIIEQYAELARNKEPLVVDFAIAKRLEKVSPYGGGTIDRPFFLEEGMELPEKERLAAADKGDNVPIEFFPELFLNTFTFYVVPMLNPDGYEIALKGYNIIRDENLREQAKDRGIPYEEWKYNARGVDINRNFPSLTWRSKFVGDEPGSENETKALIQLFSQLSAIGYLDFHSRGKAVFYHKSMMPEGYNQRQYYVATRLSEVTGYELMPPENEIDANDSGGNTVHYFSEVYGLPAITIETVVDLEAFPLDVSHQQTTFEEIILAPLEFAVAIMEYAMEQE